MIHSYNSSDLLVSIVTESDFLDHGLILRKFELAKIICVFFFWKLITIEVRMQKGATRISITQLLCCIKIADQEERLQLLQEEAGKDSVLV